MAVLLLERFTGPAHHSVIGFSCSFIMILGQVEQICSVRLKLAYRLGSALPPTMCMAGVKCRYMVSTMMTCMSCMHVGGPSMYPRRGIDSVCSEWF